MRIGYSFWGFLGNGVTDTPDGGRSHRRPLIEALRRRGHELVFLQADRDRLEAGDDIASDYTFDPHGFPAVEALFVEWRWPISGRNTTRCGSRGHTCDLHRQRELLKHYSLFHRLPTIIWDKDRKLAATSEWRRTRGVRIAEAALSPSPRAHRLLFPLDDALLDVADPVALAALPRPLTLAYVGNQYDRDTAFDRYFAPAAARVEHQVAGKWPQSARWPDLRFSGRIAFQEVEPLYRRALTTVLLLPERYAAVGQMTQRVFEAVLAGCLPLAPATIAHVHDFVPDQLIVHDGEQVLERLHWLRGIAGGDQHAELITACLRHLEQFRLTTQVDALERLLADTAAASPRPVAKVVT